MAGKKHVSLKLTFLKKSMAIEAVSMFYEERLCISCHYIDVPYYCFIQFTNVAGLKFTMVTSKAAGQTPTTLIFSRRSQHFLLTLQNSSRKGML